MGDIKTEITGAIGRIFIDSPKRFNAMSLDMWKDLRRVVETLDADPSIRVLLLRGAGEKAFVSGADISEAESDRAALEGVTAYGDAVVAAEQALMNCRLPVVASIRGICMGGGFGLSLACDLRYAARNSKFRMPAARLGMGYSLDNMRRFVDILGAARTAELFFTARTFDGAEAQRIGAVHELHADDEHDAAVERVLESIAGNAPLSLRAVKLSINALLSGNQMQKVDAAQQAIDACIVSADYIEGRKAFQEKRPARFKGI